MTDQKDVERDCPECDATGQDRNMKPVRLSEKNDFHPLGLGLFKAARESNQDTFNPN